MSGHALSVDIETVAGELLAPLGGGISVQASYVRSEGCSELCLVGEGLERVVAYWEDGPSVEAVRGALSELVLEVAQPALLGGGVERIELFTLERELSGQAQAALVLAAGAEQAPAITSCWERLEGLIAQRDQVELGSSTWSGYMDEIVGVDASLSELCDRALRRACAAAGVGGLDELSLPSEIVSDAVAAQVEIAAGLLEDGGGRGSKYALARVLAACDLARWCLAEEIPAPRG